MIDLSSAISSVISSCIDNSKKKALKCGSATARITIERLLNVSEALERTICLDASRYNITVSYGNGFFPKVPWVGITAKGRKVSNSVSVTLCFSGTGEGLVCGAMLYKRKKTGSYRTENRSGKFISLIGGSTKSDYTNRYFNPKDFYSNKISIDQLVNHIKKSIILMDTIHESNELVSMSK